MKTIKWVGVTLMLASALVLTGSVAQSTRTVLDLKSGPLINSNDVANLALVLSVEFPTVKSAYAAGSYVTTTKYLGYFNSSSCYAYNGTSSSGYFQPSGSTDANYYCNVSGAGTGFSGNFLNFVSTSAIDIVRLALTGGDRYTDESDATQPSTESEPRTILQRANLPDGSSSSNSNFYGSSSYFPTRTITGNTLISQLTPFNTSSTVAVRSCLNNIFFASSSTTTGTCPSPGTDAGLGSYKARVLVCSSTEGPVRKDLCLKYPSGRYKPVGEIQKNSDKVRVAAFGYLLDQNQSRYGGVLRAPMKFAGSTQKDASGVVSTNSAAEWSDQTGVFVDKPLNTSTETGYTYSGVINYLNRFGDSSALYKQYDPVGELFYEAVRYFQGKQPTADATSGTVTSTMLDSYPIYTTWTDPMQTSCQRNYALVVGDNQTWYDAYIPGSTISSQTRAQDGTSGAVGTLNATTWTDVLTSFETNGSTTYVDAQGVTQTANGNASPNASNTNLATKSTGAGSSASYLWAGVAYWANTQSIRSDKPKARLRTFVLDVDEGGNGTISSSVRTRAFYLAGKYGGFSDVGSDGGFYTGEGNPFKTYVSGTLTSSDNEWLAADGSTSPEGYFLASQPDRMITAIQQIFAQASKATGNLAGGATNVSRLNQQNQIGAFYQGLFNASDWSGSVVRTNLVFNTSTQKIEADSTQVWDASNILTGVQSGTTTLNPIPLPANRVIMSYSSSSRAGITFTWSNLDADVQTSLKTNPATLLLETDTDGQNRLNYLRGDRSNEGVYRGRRQLVGDVLNSGPVLKGAASSSILDSSYQSFYQSNAARTPTVYVGTNGGMLHAFYAAESSSDSNNGKELFAYVPRAISEKLNKLTNPAYSKDAYVDGAITVNEAFIYRPSAASTAWATVLASGMGGGAQGLFALDVTSPNTFAANNVLWEFTDADDADMGNVLAEPKIVKLATQGWGTATPTYKWFVMATSGYNNYKTDTYTSTANGKQFLFLLSLEKSPGQPWTLGTNYYKITANDSSFSSTTLATGMGMPGIALGDSGETVAAYAGDLQGNLWKFDLTGGASTWTGSTQAKALFLAKTSAGVSQPITVVPVVSAHPLGGYQVSFGTGKFLEPGDAQSSSAAQQSLYNVWDAADGKTVQRSTTGSGSSAINGLISRTLTVGTSTISITGSTFAYGTVNGSTYRGWYVDLSDTMERVAVDPVLSNGVLAINSTIPGDTCSTSGSSRQYRLNGLVGTSFTTVVVNNTVGYLGSPLILLAGDAAWGTRLSSGRYVVTRKVNTLSAGTSGGSGTVESTTSSVGGRISWREINQ